MGLDITAYSRLTPVGDHTEGEWCEKYDEDFNRLHVQAYAYDAFPHSFRGLPILSTRTIGSGERFLWGGCYAVTDETKTHGFRAGSYTSYGHWRRDLQSQFNHASEPDRPFYELIWFADNEGSIGPEAARDLLADFEAHAEDYVGSEYAREKYGDWTRACQLAADGGLISFH